MRTYDYNHGGLPTPPIEGPKFDGLAFFADMMQLPRPALPTLDDGDPHYLGEEL